MQQNLQSNSLMPPAATVVMVPSTIVAPYVSPHMKHWPCVGAGEVLQPHLGSSVVLQPCLDTDNVLHHCAGNANELGPYADNCEGLQLLSDSENSMRPHMGAGEVL